MKAPREVTFKIYDTNGFLVDRGSIAAPKGHRIEPSSLRPAIDSLCSRLEADNGGIKFQSIPTSKNSFSIVPIRGNT